MNKREELMKITTYEEFDRRRDEFKGMEFDKELFNHVAGLFPRSNAGDQELYKTKPEPGKKKSIGR